MSGSKKLQRIKSKAKIAVPASEYNRSSYPTVAIAMQKAMASINIPQGTFITGSSDVKKKIIKNAKSQPCVVPISSKLHEIRVKILSNYGDAKEVSCSEIDVLDQQKISIPIIEYSYAQEWRPTKQLSELFNRVLIKNDVGSIWKEDWPPSYPYTYLELVIRLETSRIIDSLRIWPQQFNKFSNIKDVVVYYDGSIVYSGILDPDFCSYVPLRFTSSFISPDLASTVPNIVENVVDSFGIVPIPRTSNIDVSVLSVYGDGVFYGLSHIRIYRFDGELIDASNVVIRSHETGLNMSCLFNEPEDSGSMFFESWKARFNNKSGFSIVFPYPMAIACIEFTNFYTDLDTPSCGVKKAVVRINGNPVWIGSFGQRNFIIDDEDSSLMQYIFLTGDEDTINNVINSSRRRPRPK